MNSNSNYSRTKTAETNHLLIISSRIRYHYDIPKDHTYDIVASLKFPPRNPCIRSVHRTWYRTLLRSFVTAIIELFEICPAPIPIEFPSHRPRQSSFTLFTLTTTTTTSKTSLWGFEFRLDDLNPMSTSLLHIPLVFGVVVVGKSKHESWFKKFLCHSSREGG